MKRIFAFVGLLFLLVTQLYALNYSFNDGAITVSADYFPSASPGDAVFVRLNFDGTGQMREQPIISATLEFIQSDKRLAKADFYFLESEEANYKGRKEMLAGIPLSTYITSKNTYQIKITYTINDAAKKTFTLPISIRDKEFFEEVIALNETNTAIRTDTSKERMDQIERLNKIYATTDTAGIHTIEPFITPIPADTRRSSFFGDRRTYAYSNGKKATSLHFGPDFAVPTGTKVIAPARGKVVMAENRISTGWSIVIEHLPGLYSIYYHMSRLDVKVGQMVSQGDLLGASGATGMVTGPHLHWEMRLLAEAVSPDFFVGRYVP